MGSFISIFHYLHTVFFSLITFTNLQKGRRLEIWFSFFHHIPSYGKEIVNSYKIGMFALEYQLCFETSIKLIYNNASL